MRPGTTYNTSGKSSYANFEIGPDLNKPYVQVVKQQVKMYQDDLHEILVKVTYKVHLVRSYGLEDMSKTSQT